MKYWVCELSWVPKIVLIQKDKIICIWMMKSRYLYKYLGAEKMQQVGLFFHVIDPSLKSRTPYGPWTPPGVIPELKCRHKYRLLWPKQKSCTFFIFCQHCKSFLKQFKSCLNLINIIRNNYFLSKHLDIFKPYSIFLLNL